MSSCRRGRKRKMATSSKATFLSPSLLLLEIPADTDTTLPVWEAMRSHQLSITWTVNPYSIGVHLTPVTSNQGKAAIKSESTPSVAPTSNILQCIVQQEIASSMQFNFSQNIPSLQCPPSHPQENPNPAASIIMSLPLIITHFQPVCQPGTPSKKKALPTIQTPTSKPQTPSEAPVPFLFHTRPGSDIHICDMFLLNLCHAGEKCRMHHTPYPFHWQLWHTVTQQWVDISPRSQVLLERIYCDVSQESVCLKDGQASYTLDFQSMEVNDPSRYARVRRLYNSDCPIMNPHFPCKWKFYWWNYNCWEEYSETISTFLRNKMSEKEPQCSFWCNSIGYKADFVTMTQINIATGVQRNIRCRPVYRSPDSMEPHLQTSIQSVLTQPVVEPPAANFSVDPLADFTSWYPPVWSCAAEQDYSLVEVPAGTQAYRRVQNLFYESLPETALDIVSIQQVQNLLHWDKYQRHKVHMLKQYSKHVAPLERHLFHGTTKEASEDICYNNFDPRMAGVNGTLYGFGTYFATAASFSNTYSLNAGAAEVRHMFLAKVLVGKVKRGRRDYRRPPPLTSKTKQPRLYDTCVDNMTVPTMFVVFDSCQCYPYYLIKYKQLPKEVDI